MRIAAPVRAARIGTAAAVAVVLPLAVGCDDGATPSVDTSIVLPGGGIETTVPVGTDPQATPAPNPNAGAGGATPTPTAGTSSP